MGITFNARQTICGPCLFVYFPLAEFGFSVSIVGLDENLVKTWLYLHAQTGKEQNNFHKYATEAKVGRKL